MIDFNNDFYKNPGKFIYECQDVVFENFDSSKKEFIKSNLRHDSYTDLKYFRKFSDMTQFYKLSEWDYLYEGLVRSASGDNRAQLLLGISLAQGIQADALFLVFVPQRQPALSGDGIAGGFQKG